MEIIIPSVETIIELNKRIGGSIINRGLLDFLISKIESKHKSKDAKHQIAKIAAIFWKEIIQKHPFLDGNKRTATECVELFLWNNRVELRTTLAGKIYISLKLANNELNYEELVKWIYERIKVVK